MIDTISLVNFLSHRDTKIELDDGVSVFIGNNGSGKSSVIDALTYALYGKHTRGNNNASIVSHGASGGYASVTFTVNGRTYTVERKFGRSGRLEGAILKDVTSGLVVAGERRQYGESVEDEVQKILGLDYDKMKVVAIIQQGELDWIVNYSPKDFKELINSVVGADKLSVAYDSMGSSIGKFKQKVSEKCYGYDSDSLGNLDEEITRLKAEKANVSAEKESIEKQLAPLLKEKDGADREYHEMAGLKAKAEDLKYYTLTFKKHVEGKRKEMENNKSRIEANIPLAIKYLATVEGGVERRLEVEKGKLGDLSEKELKLAGKVESAKNAAETVAELKKEIREIQRHIKQNENKVLKLEALKKAIDGTGLLPKKVAKAELEKARKKLKELENDETRLETFLDNYSKIEKTGMCPVCGSTVEEINVDEKRSHKTEELNGIKQSIRVAKSKESEMNTMLDRIREYEEISSNNKNTESRIRDIKGSTNNLMQNLGAKNGELSEEIKKARGLRRLQKQKESVSEKKTKAGNLVQELSNELTEARTWLSSADIKSRDDIKNRQYDLAQLKVKLAGPDSELDDTAKELSERIENLKAETARYSDKRYNSLEVQVNELGGRISELKSDITKKKSIVDNDSEQLDKFEPARQVVAKSGVYVEKFGKIRDEIFHRDGALATAIRSWAMRGISDFASDYAQLFGTGISEVKISEGDSKVGIECYTSSGFQDIRAMSGGEKVAVALAIRFAIAKLLSSGNIDFIILDEPTNYLDEERKKAFVDLVQGMGQTVKQLVIITHDSEIFERESINAAFTFEKVAEETRVAKS